MPLNTEKPVAVTQGDRSRFWAKVEVRGKEECWPWTGHTNERGYGSMSHCGRLRKATHISYEIETGSPFPTGMVARHTCDNPTCVNPAHIVPGTLRDNAMDMVSRRRHHANRRDECIRGHPFSGDNLIVRPGGQRGCRAEGVPLKVAAYRVGWSHRSARRWRRTEAEAAA
jgi:hypothetical protein